VVKRVDINEERERTRGSLGIELPEPPDGSRNRWVDRVVAREMVDPHQLLASPKNYRIHPTLQQDAVEGSLDELGWLDEVLVNRLSGTVIDGHLRVQLALRNGEASIPVRYVEFSDEEENKALAVKDTTTTLAGVDREKYRDLLQAITPAHEQLKEFIDRIYTQVAPAAALAPAPGEAPGEEAAPEAPYDPGSDAEVTVTIECLRSDLEEMQATLRKWGRKPTVTVNFLED
jgi:hypothetical protein